jgi:uncharacterized membrane protein
VFNRKNYLFSVILAVLGLLDAIYLSWIKLSNSYVSCGPIGDCKSVQSSPYAEIGGIPIAILGVIGFLFIIIFLFIENRASKYSDAALYLVFSLSLAGTLYSGYLTYLEIAVIHAICPYCVVSAIALMLLFALSVSRLANSRLKS